MNLTKRLADECSVYYISSSSSAASLRQTTLLNVFPSAAVTDWATEGNAAHLNALHTLQANEDVFKYVSISQHQSKQAVKSLFQALGKPLETHNMRNKVVLEVEEVLEGMICQIAMEEQYPCWFEQDSMLAVDRGELTAVDWMPLMRGMMHLFPLRHRGRDFVALTRDVVSCPLSANTDASPKLELTQTKKESKRQSVKASKSRRGVEVAAEPRIEKRQMLEAVLQHEAVVEISFEACDCREEYTRLYLNHFNLKRKEQG
jgi:hypothetical protein